MGCDMNKQGYDYSLLSKHRDKIMGFAILWIILFHCSGDLSGIPVLGLIKNYGNVGVDMFLVMSGIGLYYSAEKLAGNRKSLKWIPVFYRKRLQRLMPATLVCLMPWYLYLNLGHVVEPGRFILDISSLSFWIDGQNRGWYVAFSLLLYFLYPLLFFVIRAAAGKGEPRAQYWIAMAAIMGADVAVNTALASAFPDWFGVLDIALCRVPVFVAGCFIAVPVKRNVKRPAVVPVLSVAAAALSIFVLEEFGNLLQTAGIWRYLYGIAGLSLCIVLSFIFEKVRWKWLHFLFSFTGRYTLELYLTHTQFLSVLLDLAGARFGDSFAVTLACNAVAIIAAFLTAVIIHRIFYGRTGYR